MPKIVSRIQDPPMRDENVTGFLGGLNIFQDETVIRDSELTKAKNILLSVDGIEPRPGTKRNGGNGSDSKVLGLFGYYKADGSRMILRAQGQRIKTGFTTPTQIDATAFDLNAPVNFVQARDDVYLFNGVNELRKTNGSLITSYTTLSTPSAIAISPQGTVGTEVYSYRVSAFNAVGETLASVAASISNGNAALSATNYNKIHWPAVTGATGYNVWGRTATGLGETYMATLYATSLFNDDIVDADINTGTDVITVIRDCTTGEEVKWGGSGTVPTGFTAGTSYYVIRVSATTIKLATSLANAQAGTAVDITAVGSGTRTLTWQSVLMYEDKGQDDPSLVLIPPEGNTTAGIKCKFGCFAISRIFAAGDPDNPSRLYYGGVGSHIGNFSGSSEGGGYVDVFRNDGSIIRSILPFQGGVIVWKDNAIYKFSFNANGFPQLEEITRSFGGISFQGCRHVENDVIFPAKKDGRLAFYSLGNQENYSGSVLRTNELSIKIAKDLQDVNLANLDDSCAFYYQSIYGCAVPKSGNSVNNRVWCLDTRFGAWVYWEGFSPNCFATYVDTDGSEKLYYGDALTGYVVEMFRDERNDDDTAIDVEWATKSFNQKAFKKHKDYYNPTFQFKDVTQSGVVTGEIILDGFISNATFSVNAPDSGGAGVGVMLPGFPLFGEAGGGTVVTGLSADTLSEVDAQYEARSIKYQFHSNSKNARYKFLSLSHEYQILEDRRLDQKYRSYPT